MELELRRRQENGELVDDSIIDYTRYQNDPYAFGKEIFGEDYTEDIISVMESVRDNRITIAKSGNGTGKSHGAARVALWFYKCFKGAKVYTAAAPPESNLKTILWGEIGGLVEQYPDVFKDDRITLDMQMKRSSQEFLMGVSIPSTGTPEHRQAKFSGKHAPYLLFIVDEGDAVPEEVYKGIESCMSGGIIVRLLIMFNPRGEYGPVANMEKKKQGNVIVLSALNHPNVITGENLIPGAVDRDTTVRRFNNWTRALAPDEIPDNECVEVPDFLVGTTAKADDGTMFPPLPAGHRKIIEIPFWYMVLGQYPPQSETQLISRTWCENAVSRYMTYLATFGERPPTDTGISGLDVAEFGTDFNILTYRFGNYMMPQKRWNGLDPDATAIKTHNYMYSSGFILRAMVDGTGIGAGIAPRMVRLGSDAYTIKVAWSPTYETEIGEFDRMRDQLWWSTREWLRDEPNHPSYAMIPPDNELIEELCTPQYTVDNGKIYVTKKAIMKEMLGRSPDKADSLCLTFADEEVAAAEVGENPMSGYRGG